MKQVIIKDVKSKYLGLYQKHTRKPQNSGEESGRSMLEMLSVLAIIGVLSIGAVWGYRYAISKYQSNEIVDAVNMRMVTVSDILSHGGSHVGVIQDGLPNQIHLGQPIKSVIAPENPDYFKIEVDEIEPDTCRHILQDYKKALFTQVNQVIYQNNLSVCGNTEPVTMGFVFKNDLGHIGACSTKGYFGSEDFQCHCSGNTYIDPSSHECVCPAGHIWSAADNTCVESICEEGEFESLAAGCIPCDAPATHTIMGDANHQRLCRACGNRYVYLDSNNLSKNLCINTDVHNCVAGESFMGRSGTCISCNSTQNTIDVGSKAPEIVDLCNACPDYMWQGLFCFKPAMCTKGKQFFIPHLASGTVQCRPCSDPESYNIFNLGLSSPNLFFEEYCLACENAAGEKNRRMSGNTCIKTVCDSGEFKGMDGKCYACSLSTKIKVNTGSGCEAEMCGREVVNGYCQIANCQTDDGSHVAINGNCYPCSGTANFSATKAQCETCQSPKRLWLGTYQNESTQGTCVVSCTKGVNYPYGRGTFCYACSGWGNGSGYSGTTATAQEYCTACGNYLDGGYCVRPDSCKRGLEFREKVTSYSFCRTCDYTDKVNVGTTAGHRDMCQACSSQKRFIIGSYCYRCDSPETPVVVESNDVEACASCDGKRQVKDGKCILKQ